MSSSSAAVVVVVVVVAVCVCVVFVAFTKFLYQKTLSFTTHPREHNGDCTRAARAHKHTDTQTHTIISSRARARLSVSVCVRARVRFAFVFAYVIHTHYMYITCRVHCTYVPHTGAQYVRRRNKHVLFGPGSDGLCAVGLCACVHACVRTRLFCPSHTAVRDECARSHTHAHKHARMRACAHVRGVVIQLKVSRAYWMPIRAHSEPHT